MLRRRSSVNGHWRPVPGRPAAQRTSSCSRRGRAGSGRWRCCCARSAPARPARCPRSCAPPSPSRAPAAPGGSTCGGAGSCQIRLPLVNKAPTASNKQPSCIRMTCTLQLSLKYVVSAPVRPKRPTLASRLQCLTPGVGRAEASVVRTSGYMRHCLSIDRAASNARCAQSNLFPAGALALHEGWRCMFWR